MTDSYGFILDCYAEFNVSFFNNGLQVQTTRVKAAFNATLFASAGNGYNYLGFNWAVNENNTYLGVVDMKSDEDALVHMSAKVYDLVKGSNVFTPNSQAVNGIDVFGVDAIALPPSGGVAFGFLALTTTATNLSYTYMYMSVVTNVRNGSLPVSSDSVRSSAVSPSGRSTTSLVLALASASPTQATLIVRYADHQTFNATSTLNYQYYPFVNYTGGYSISLSKVAVSPTSLGDFVCSLIGAVAQLGASLPSLTVYCINASATTTGPRQPMYDALHYSGEFLLGSCF